MRDTYVYPAVFEYADDGISISFPDIQGCFSCADNDEEALASAREALGLHLTSLETDGDPVPDPTPLKNIPCGPNRKPVLVEVFMPPVRKAVVAASVKKTLTIPAWLDALARRHDVNFSQLLQDALRKHLGINPPT